MNAFRMYVLATNVLLFDQIVSGDHNVEKHEEGEHHSPVCSIKIHPHYTRGSVSNDIALVEASRFSFTNKIVSLQ